MAKAVVNLSDYQQIYSSSHFFALQSYYGTMHCPSRNLAENYLFSTVVEESQLLGETFKLFSLQCSLAGETLKGLALTS